MPTKQEHDEQIKAKLLPAKQIHDSAKAASREFTPAESAQVAAILADVDATRKAYLRSAAADSKSLMDEIDANLGGEPTDGKQYFATVGKSIAAQAAAALTDSGAKSLVPSGTIDLTQFVGGFADGTKARRKRFLAELVFDSSPLTSEVMSFLRQTVRTNNAAPVARGAVKPTSVYSFLRDTARVETIAHISEAMERQNFMFHADLARVLQDEMLYGLALKVDDQIINGDGSTPDHEGVLATSGTLAQAFATDVLTTTRKAVTKLDDSGVVPNYWVINSADAEALDLMENSDGDLLNDASFHEVGKRVLWGVPYIVSPVLAAGQAILADWSGATLRQAGNVEFAWSETSNADDFSKNLIRLRTEGHWAFAVKKPDNFVIVDLTA